MKKLPVALLLLLFCSVAAVSRAPAQTSTTAPARPVLVIQSTPGGAQVYVDDELLGTTSPEGRLRISTLKPGKHTLRLSLDGRRDLQMPITLVAAQTLTKAVTLKAQNVLQIPPEAPPASAGNGTVGANAGGPPLADTLNWIKDTLQNDPGSIQAYSESLKPTDGSALWQKDFGSHSSLRQDNGCKITLLTKWTSEFTRPGATSTNAGDVATSMNLSELDPRATTAITNRWESSFPGLTGADTVSGELYSTVFLKATDNRPVLISTRVGSDIQQNAPATNQASVSFNVGNQDLAARLVSAFKHAIEVCGGKPSAF